MVDATEAMESAFLTAEVVANSATKKIVITHGGDYEETDYGRKLTVKIQIDSKEKQFRPNKESVRNMIASWGKNSDEWVGKVGDVKVTTINGKLCVIVTPTLREQKHDDADSKPE